MTPLTRADIEQALQDALFAIRAKHANTDVERIRDLATTALGLLNERDEWAGRWAHAEAGRVTKKPCDIYEDGSEEPCAGPRFTDPGAHGDPEMSICAFHALLNRNYWMNRANTAEELVKNMRIGVAQLMERADTAEARIRDLTAERDRAITHDTQPYPTAAAYERLCATLRTAKTRIGTLEGALRKMLDYQEHSSSCAQRLAGERCDCGRRQTYLEARALLTSERADDVKGDE